jgi:drug/metabolite transporter (DMT)-like permease
MAGAQSAAEAAPLEPQLAGSTDGRGIAAAAAAVLVWGLVPVAVRHFVSGLDPITFSAIRFAWMALLGLPLMIWAAPWRWPTWDIVRLVACGVFALPGLNTPLAIAARAIPAGGIGLITATEPIFIMLFTLVLARGVSIRVAAGAMIAFAGVLVALSTSAEALVERTSLGAVLLGLVGSASWGLYTVLCAPLARRYGARAMTGGVLVLGGGIGALVLAPFSGPDGRPELSIILQIGLLVLSSSLLGFLLWNYAASLMRPAPMGLLLYFLPVIAIIGGFIFLDEPISLRDVAGGALILLGVSLGEGRLRLRL